MAKDRTLQDAVSNEVWRTVLREAEDRYRNELMSNEERYFLLAASGVFAANSGWRSYSPA